MENTQQQPYPQPQAAPPPPQQQQQQQHMAAATSSPSSPCPETTVITTPVWLVFIRGFQFFLAIIILGLSATIIRWVYLDELGLSLAMVCLLILGNTGHQLTPTSPSSRGS